MDKAGHNLPGKTSGSVVADWIRHRAEEAPDAPAFLAPGTSALSNAALHDQCLSIASQLGVAGIGPSSRLAIFHSGGIDMAAVVAAVWTHCTALPINVSTSAADWDRWLAASSVNALVIEDGMFADAVELANKHRLPIIRVSSQQDGIAGHIEIDTSDCNLPPTNTDDPTDLRLILATSGTSGEAKLVPIYDRHLKARAEQISAALELSGQDRCVNMMSLAHVGGLSAGLASNLYAGASFASPRRGDARQALRNCASLGATYIAAPYTVFHDIARVAGSMPGEVAELRPALRMLRTGAGHLDHNAASKLEKIFGAPVVEAYGSSETGFMATTMKGGRQSTPGYVGHSAGCEISIRDQAFLPVEKGSIGEVWVRGENVVENYLAPANAKRSVFTRNWYCTGDLGSIDSNGALVLAGRKSDLINRGGILLSPQPIEEAASNFPGVQEVACFPVPHPTLGEDIAIAIVAEEGTQVSVAELRRHLAQHLPDSARPQSIITVADIPRSGNGKIVRRLLAKQLVPDTSMIDDDFQSDTERVLASIWRDVLRNQAVGRDDDFFALGGDSLKALEVFMSIEQQLGICLPRSIVFEAGTISELAKRIETSDKYSCIVPIKPDGVENPLFCIHGQDGGVIVFRELAERLPDELPFYGVQSPWLAGQTVRFDSLESLAKHYVEEIRSVQESGPYRIAGYSMGGRMALAVAQRLLSEDEVVEILLLLDSYSGIGRRQKKLGPRWRGYFENLKSATASERAAFIASRLRRPFTKLLTKLGRAHKRFLLSRDRQDAPLDANLIRFVNGRLNSEFRPESYAGRALLIRLDNVRRHTDVYDGWKQVFTGPFDTRMARGTHLNMFEPPTVDQVAEIIADTLEINQA